MNIKEVIEMNNNGMSCKQIGEEFGVSKSTVQRFIVKAGYVYDSKTKKYFNPLADSDSDFHSNDDLNNVVFYSDSEGNNNFEQHKVDEVEQVSSEAIEKFVNEKMVNGSYTIPVSVAKALKLKAVLEEKKAIDIVREAIENSIEPKYFNM